MLDEDRQATPETVTAVAGYICEFVKQCAKVDYNDILDIGIQLHEDEEFCNPYGGTQNNGYEDEYLEGDTGMCESLTIPGRFKTTKSGQIYIRAYFKKSSIQIQAYSYQGLLTGLKGTNAHLSIQRFYPTQVSLMATS